MTKRILLAGLAGGLVMFLWGSLSHMVLGLGEVGVKEIPNEQAVLTSMQTSMPEAGFYLFPGLGLGPDATRAQKSAALQIYSQKARTEPTGILVYHPVGAVPLSLRMLLTEFGLNIVLALIAAALLSRATALVTFTSRVAFVTLAGVMAALTTNVQYWNWYGFPTNYTIAYIANLVIAFALTGVAVSLIIGRAAAQQAGSSRAAA